VESKHGEQLSSSVISLETTTPENYLGFPHAGKQNWKNFGFLQFHAVQSVQRQSFVKCNTV